MSGVDRSPARNAGNRCGIVALEVRPVLTEEVLGLEIGLTEILHLLRLIHRREAHLIAHEDQEIRPFPFEGVRGPAHGTCLGLRRLTVLRES